MRAPRTPPARRRVGAVSPPVRLPTRRNSANRPRRFRGGRRDRLVDQAAHSEKSQDRPRAFVVPRRMTPMTPPAGHQGTRPRAPPPRRRARGRTSASWPPPQGGRVTARRNEATKPSGSHAMTRYARPRESSITINRTQQAKVPRSPSTRPAPRELCRCVRPLPTWPRDHSRRKASSPHALVSVQRMTVQLRREAPSAATVCWTALRCSVHRCAIRGVYSADLAQCSGARTTIGRYIAASFERSVRRIALSLDLRLQQHVEQLDIAWVAGLFVRWNETNRNRARLGVALRRLREFARTPLTMRHNRWDDWQLWIEGVARRVVRR